MRRNESALCTPSRRHATNAIRRRQRSILRDECHFKLNGIKIILFELVMSYHLFWRWRGSARNSMRLSTRSPSHCHWKRNFHETISFEWCVFDSIFGALATDGRFHAPWARRWFKCDAAALCWCLVFFVRAQVDNESKVVNYMKNANRKNRMEENGILCCRLHWIIYGIGQR